MLNIRINFTVNLKKVGAVVLSAIVATSQLLTPANAVEVKSVKLVKRVVKETPITVRLSRLWVKTTKTEARQALASPQAKYFDAEAVAFLTVYTKDWTIKEWKCLQSIWNRESHFNALAQNKDTNAFGIAQFMPTTWGNYNVEKTTDSKLQVQYGLRYIQVRYGSACKAKEFWERKHWY